MSFLCRGCKKHARLDGGGAGPAAVYPKGLCRAVCRGVIAQMQADAADMVAIDCVDLDKSRDLQTEDEPLVGVEYGDGMPLFALEGKGEHKLA